MNRLRPVLQILLAVGLLPSICQATEGTLANPAFDEDLSGWENTLGLVVWDELDAAGAPDSGSALGTVGPGLGLWQLLIQCLPAVEHAFYEYGASVFIPAGQSTVGSARVRIHWARTTTCNNFFLGTESVITTAAGSWVELYTLTAAPPQAQSVIVTLSMTRPDGPDLFSAHFDDVVFAAVAAYALDYLGQELRVHPVHGYPDQATVGTQSLPLSGLDFDKTATVLYAIDSSNGTFGTLDLETAAFSAIGPLSPGGSGWSALAVDPSTAIVYALRSGIGSPELYTVDASTGSTALVGQISGVPGAIVDIAVNCDREMYAHDVDSDAIYRIDPATAVGTLVGPTGFDASLDQGMDFDNATDTLYAWFMGDDELFRYGVIDLSDGSLSVLSTDSGVRYRGATRSTCQTIFADGFETGDTAAWSNSVP